MATVDFDEAIKAHSDWKMKLATYLRKPDGSLKPADVCMDNACALGKWIHGDGRKYAAIPDYGTLKAEHAAFHAETANIVRRANAGEQVKEETALSADSEFTRASKAVVQSIMKMRRIAN